MSLSDIPTPEQLLASRSGSVLDKYMILKSDHFFSGAVKTLKNSIFGAPNFRETALSIYGVAQPTSIGLATILTLLNCYDGHLHSNTTISASGDSASAETNIDLKTCIWINSREEPVIYVNDKPFVLREETSPFVNIQAYKGINSYRLELMEQRLKKDIIHESQLSKGLIVIHEEKDSGEIIPCLTALLKVETPREVFEYYKSQGYRVSYYRLPISPEKAPSEKYLDSVLEILERFEISQPVVFNCGMGIGRTSHSMIVALLIKRYIALKNNLPDPFETQDLAQEELQRKTLLGLIFVLENVFKNNNSSFSIAEWTLERSGLIENLLVALRGNYYFINYLCSVLDKGPFCKKIVDRAIDSCEQIINVREIILQKCITHSLNNNIDYINAGINWLERYFLLIAFSSFLEFKREFYIENHNLAVSSNPPRINFSSWTKERPEIWSMLQYQRNTGPKLLLFRPIDDLSSLKVKKGLASNSTAGTTSDSENYCQESCYAYDDNNYSYKDNLNVLKNRMGMILGPYMMLKIDQWYNHPAQVLNSDSSRQNSTLISGANNFREMSGHSIYGVAQPTRDGMEFIFFKIFNKQISSSSLPLISGGEVNGNTVWDHHHSSIGSSPSQVLLWINLREEPIVFINNSPFVLRDQYTTLRNIKSYMGISRGRLEALEERLVEDIVSEINLYNGKLLLHEEDQNKKLYGKWNSIDQESIQSTKTLFDKEIARNWPNIYYFRVPLTAEEAPETNDFDAIMDIILSYYPTKVNVLMSCQTGFGRSTIGMIICTMIFRWLYSESDLEREKVKESCSPHYSTNSASISTTSVNSNGSSGKKEETSGFISAYKVPEEPLVNPHPENTLSSSFSEPQVGEFSFIDGKELLFNNDLQSFEKDKPSYFYSPPELSSSVPVSEESQNPSPPPSNYRIIKSLLRVISNGIKSKRSVDELIDLASAHLNQIKGLAPSHILHSISYYYKQMELASDYVTKYRAVRKGIQQLKRYFLLIAFQSYIFQLAPAKSFKDFQSLQKFSAWINGYPEILFMIQREFDSPHPSLESLAPESEIDLANIYSKDNSGFKNEAISKVIKTRDDSVLAPNMILKFDHFPGCQQGSLPIRIEGSPNFRRVVFHYHHSSASFSFHDKDMDFEKALFIKENSNGSSGGSSASNEADIKKRYIYGLAIPTESSIKTILDRIEIIPTESPEARNRKILWTNLREEPILYVNGNPFVLRSLDLPWNNLETTGIERERVEWMEERMKNAALRELELYQGKLLLHDETIQNSKPIILHYWEPSVKENIATASEIFRNISNQGHCVDYFRLPITDEQSPISFIIDSLLERHWKTPTNVDYVFNCQMGRGRTTTGMVIASLIEVILYKAQLKARKEKSLDSLAAKSPEELKYLNGNYKVILQLVQVLEFGRVAKKITDICIDYCDHIQNLREAVFDFALKINAQKKANQYSGAGGGNLGQSVYKSSLYTRGLNYLVRYFYLIVFANYLLYISNSSSNTESDDTSSNPGSPQQKHPEKHGKKTWKSHEKFSSWLHKRKEINNLANNQFLDFI